MTVRVAMPFHLRTLARVDGEVSVEVEANADGRVTIESVIDALEAKFPMLRGTIRDHETKRRRAFLRFFACQRDLTHEASGTPLPGRVVDGEEPLLIVGAIAGG